MTGPPLPTSPATTFAIWRTGDVQAAALFALAAIARADRDEDMLRELLERLRAGERLPVPQDVPALDEALAVALVDRARFHEARILLETSKLDDSPTGRRLAPLLEECMAPVPSGADASFEAMLHLVRAGQAPSALRALDEVVQESGRSTPKWLRKRHRALASLVRGEWREGPAPVQNVTRDTVLLLLRGRDLAGAQEAARRASQRDPSARELAAVLARLVASTEKVFSEAQEELESSTMPMEGHGLAQFQVRMGVLSQADRSYRALLSADPDDDRARAQLSDVVALRQALGENPEPVPKRMASVAWLNKKGPRARFGGWASSGEGQANPRIDFSSDDSSTDVVEAAQEAELLLKLGKAEMALDMYRILVIRHPRRAAYQKRIAEIEALIAQRGVPNSAEVTLRHDVDEIDDLSRNAVATRVKMALDPPHPRFRPGDDEFSTMIEKVPESLRFLGDEDTDKG